MEINQENKNSFVIPFFILIAGVVIATAVFLGLGNNNDSLAKGDSNDVVEIDADDDFVLGSPSATVTFINFGDFRCRFCAMLQKDIKPIIIEKYVKTGKVKYIYRDFITMGENSILAAGGANCAGEQGKYWDFANYLHSGEVGANMEYTEKSLFEIAKYLSLDDNLFKECLSSGKYIIEVKKGVPGGYKSIR